MLRWLDMRMEGEEDEIEKEGRKEKERKEE